MGKLEQKVAIITGGARGMGREIALTLAREGADIAVADMLDMDGTAQEVTRLGRKVITVKTDITQKNQVQNLIDRTIETFFKVDILVNNAGINRRTLILEMAEEEWDRILAVNLKGTFLCTQAAARHMVERKCGRIINIASVNGVNNISARSSHYSASKAGIIQFTKVCALELGPHGINVNAIAPGTTRTDMNFVQRTPEEVEQAREQYKNKVALRRVGDPQDIANLVLFLASEDSSFITGQVIVADGGSF